MNFLRQDAIYLTIHLSNRHFRQDRLGMMPTHILKTLLQLPRFCTLRRWLVIEAVASALREELLAWLSLKVDPLQYEF